jgi:hypothetical protein
MGRVLWKEAIPSFKYYLDNARGSEMLYETELNSRQV